MIFSRDKTLRLTDQVDVDAYPEEPRSARVYTGIHVGNKWEAESAQSKSMALLSCRGSLPEWWSDHEKRDLPAIALGLDDREITHCISKRTLLPIAHDFICGMRYFGHPVLVYCYHGSSRSVVVAAYHIAIEENICAFQALDKVMSEVPWAAPSVGMIELLLESLHTAEHSDGR